VGLGKFSRPNVYNGKNLRARGPILFSKKVANVKVKDNAWFQGLRPRDFAPNVYKLSRKKNRSLKGALDNNWIRDINLQHRGFTAQVFTEYAQLWRAVVQL
jgi:hypothetical protein